MTRFELLMGKLAEESSEVAKIALKTQQFGLDSCHPASGHSNRDELHLELNDVLAIVKMLNEEFCLGFEECPQHIQRKQEAVNTWGWYACEEDREEYECEGMDDQEHYCDICSSPIDTMGRCHICEELEL